MKIELKNVKHMASLSEETNCFTATVYLDGKRAGEVSNRGHGGCNDYHPFELGKRLADYAKTLPEVTDKVPLRRENGVMIYEDWTHQPDGDSLIDDLLTEWLYGQDMKKAMSGRVLFMRDGKVYETKKQPAAVLAGWLRPDMVERTRVALKADKILNVLPFAEALALFKSNATMR